MTNVETLGALKRRLKAFIPQQQLRGEFESRLKYLGRTAKIQGFRPGKVPLKILEQHYGAQVHQEVLGEAIQRSFAEHAQANKLSIAGYPSFAIESKDPAAEQIEYSATFEVYPEIVLGDVSKQSVEKITYTLTDADVNNTIETLRKQRPRYVRIERAAQEHDQVSIDFNGRINGADVFEGGQASGYPVVLGTGRMLAEFEQGVIGMKEGETKVFDVNFPEDYHGKDVAGKRVEFTVTVIEVQEPILLEVDDKFARAVGVDGGVDKLKSEIRKSLAMEIERRVKAHNKNNAMEALLNISELEVPKVLVDADVKNLTQQTLDEMRERGVEVPVDLPVERFVESARKRVKLGLISAELVKRHKLDAQPEQIKALLETYAQSFEQPEEVVKWHYSDPERLKEVEHMVLEDNVVNWVLQGAKMTEKMATFDELMGKKG